MRSTTATVDGNLIERLRAGRLPSVSARRSLRKDAGASYRDLADVLGVSPMTVRRWEMGEVEPRLANAIAYRRLLDELREVVK